MPCLDAGRGGGGRGFRHDNMSVIACASPPHPGCEPIDAGVKVNPPPEQADDWDFPFGGFAPGGGRVR